MADKKSKLDQELIRQLADLLNETGLTEIEIENDETRVRVARSVTVAAAAVPAAAPAAAAPLPNSPSAGVPASDATHPGALASPMVGTAYLSPSPGEKPFVDVGSTVRQGETVLIVEAMKTMNQIPAQRAGRVTKIFVQDGQPVEFGEPLLIIE